MTLPISQRPVKNITIGLRSQEMDTVMMLSRREQRTPTYIVTNMVREMINRTAKRLVKEA